jgi:hypothetical protein
MMPHRIFALTREGRKRYCENQEDPPTVQKIYGSIPVELRESGEGLKLGLWFLVQGSHLESKWTYVYRFFVSVLCKRPVLHIFL